MEEGCVKFMTRAELITTLDEHAEFTKRAWIPVFAYLAFFAIILWWANYHREIISERASVIIILIGVYGGAFVGIIFLGKRMKRHRVKLGLSCPQCKKDLIGGYAQIAVASGRCGRCGTILLEDWNK
jgi:hypothetical protein